jgi:hypothetical protein
MENTGLLINLINFNWGQFIWIRKYRFHTQYEILTYSATNLARRKTPDDGRIRPKHVVCKKGDL